MAPAAGGWRRLFATCLHRVVAWFRGFAVWRVLLWLLLLLAAFGCLLYFTHARWLWGLRENIPAHARSAWQTALAWDGVYFIAAFVLIVLCAGGILRQAWARTPLRIAALLLALWALVSGVMMLGQWLPLERSSAEAIAHLASDDRLRIAILHARRSYRMALALKVVGVPVLVWLAWRLGVPSVRAQFHPRRQSAA